VLANISNLYLHYVLDLWALSWRKTQARGEMYIVRYADDFVMGFQREEDVTAMRKALAERLAEHGLELHPEKTRVIEFGRYAREDRARRGLSKPETFEFLGFMHIAGIDRIDLWREPQHPDRWRGFPRLAYVARRSSGNRAGQNRGGAISATGLCLSGPDQFRSSRGHRDR